MTPGTRLRLIHSSNSKMKEATGVARITRITGENSRSAQTKRQVNTASSTPARVPTAIPATMRPRVAATVCQKAGERASTTRERATVAG